MLRARRSLAVLRFVWLYGLLCALLLGAGLLYRDLAASDRWLWAIPESTGLPFAGTNVELEGLAPGERRVHLQELQAAGFTWVRQRIDWGNVEPHAGVYEWSQPDGWIADIIAAGLVPLVVLDGSPLWVRAPQDLAPTDNPLAPPADAEDFARFAAAFAARYGDQVRFYQIWDEPNIAPHWGNRWVEPVAYAQLLKAAAQAIRAADPDSVIATAALAPTNDRGHTAVDEIYFLQRMLAAGAADAFDAVAIQPLGFGYAPDHNIPSPAALNFQRAVHVRRAMEEMGIGDKALWAVRFGWNRDPYSPWGAVTPSDQATYAGDAMSIAWNHWPWLEAIGWAIDRPDAGAGDRRWGFALWDSGGSPAPVLAALQGWMASVRPGERPPHSEQIGAWWRWLAPWTLVAGLLFLVAWRGFAAVRLLPWLEAVEGWRRLPWVVQTAIWTGVLVVYYFATWPPLIGACWIAWVLLCLAQPRGGLALAAVLLPFYYQHKELALVNTTIAVPPAAAALACLLPAVVRVAWTKPRPFGAIDAVVLALLGISLLPALHVWHWEALTRGLVDFVLLPLGLWFALRVLRGTGERFPLDKTVAAALFGGGVLAAVWGLWAWALGNGVEVDGVRRLVGPHFSPNHTALYLLRTLFLGVGLAFACLAAQRRSARAPVTGRVNGWGWLAGAFAGASFLVAPALVMTGSRGALLLGLPVGACVFAFAGLRRRPALVRWIAGHRYARWAVFGAALLAGASVLLLWDRLLNQQTIGLRLDLWEASLRLWRDHLLLGTGPGSFPWTYPAYVSPGSSVELNQLHPHNIWLEVSVTWGLVGFAWLGVLLWLFAATVLRRWSAAQPFDWLRVGLVAALLAAVAHGQMDAFFLLPDLAAWNALALALLIGSEPLYQRPRNHSAG